MHGEGRPGNRPAFFRNRNEIMTKTQIIEKLKAAGVTGWDKKNLAELEAMAKAAGVVLEEDAGDGVDRIDDAETSKPAEAGAPLEHDPGMLITPMMACSRRFHGGDPES